MSLHQALAATCKACKEIVLTSVGFFVGDSVGFFVGDSVGFFVGDCRKSIAARQGVRDLRHLQQRARHRKEIVLTSVGFFVGDSVGFFVGDSVGFFVGDCRKSIAARQGVRDEPPSSICSNVQGMQRDCTHLRGVLRRRFGRVLRRRLGRILRGRLQEGHRSTSRRQR